MLLNSRILGFVHIDLDGVGCEILLRSIYPNIQIERINYGFESNEYYSNLLDKFDVIIMADMSGNLEFARKLDKLKHEHNKVVLLFDHHKSALDNYKDENFDWTIFDMTKSGTKIVYEFYKELYDLSRYEELVKLINDYDLWIHEYKPLTWDLQFLFSSIKQEAFAERFLLNPEIKFTSEEDLLIEESRIKLRKSYEYSRDNMKLYTDSDGNVFGVSDVLDSFTSLVAELLLTEDFKHIRYIALVSPRYQSISFRAKGYNIEPIAKSLGGGGHEEAAGATLIQLMDVPSSIIQRSVIKFL